MTESELRMRLCAAAESYLGCNEADGSHRRIIDRYNRIVPLPRGYALSYDDPWCAAFVSVIGAETGAERAVPPECSCPAMLRAYAAAGRTAQRGAAVQAGDIVMYGSAEAEHVGIITAVTGDNLRTVEGNLSDAVGARSLDRHDSRILCFCLPDYASLSGEADPAGVEQAHAGFDPAPMRYLYRGDKGEDVRAMQALLILRGFPVGIDGADGDFGANTAEALRAFQRSQGIEIDAVFGQQTLKRLWG